MRGDLPRDQLEAIVRQPVGTDCNDARAMAREILRERDRLTELLGERAELRVQRDRVTDLFEKWAAEESEHRSAGEYGIAEGFRVAIEELRMAVHGTTEPIGDAR